MAKAKPLCRTCGKVSQYGALFCTEKCEAAHIKKRSAYVSRLEMEGFERDPAFSNLFVKDGIAVSLEKIEHAGMDQTLLEHGHAVDYHKQKAG